MPTQTAAAIYVQTVRSLPPEERLRLAALILDDLAFATVPKDASPVDYSEEWTEQDTHDLTAFALTHASTQFPDEGDLA